MIHPSVNSILPVYCRHVESFKNSNAYIKPEKLITLFDSRFYAQRNKQINIPCYVDFDKAVQVLILREIPNSSKANVTMRQLVTEILCTHQFKNVAQSNNIYNISKARSEIT